MSEELKQLIGQYCQYPNQYTFEKIYEHIDNFPCPVVDTAGFIDAYHDTFDYIKRFDRERLMCGWEGEKADYLLGALEQSYFAYWDNMR
jgi:hypothetical protein